MTDRATGFDPHTPNVARMYDYFLGGKDHYVADRLAADEIIARSPDVVRCIRENRAFLGRAVRFLAGEAGIRQFLDIGAGLPTQDNVHEVAQRLAPDARVAYVDNDPAVLAHGRALLAKSPEVRIVPADVRRPAEILAHREVRELLDLDKPVAVLLVAVLHFIADAEDPAWIVKQLRDAVPAGSYLVISHGTNIVDPSLVDHAESTYDRANAPLALRPYAEVRGFFDGAELVDPGLVDVVDWRPERAGHAGTPASVLAGVARLD